MSPNSQIPSPPPAVLVVDDDSALCAALSFSLQIENYAVQTYTCAADLLAEKEVPRHGCMVVDYKMPDMNGLDLVARLRERGVTLPAILITGSPPEAVRRRAAQAGITVVEKPLFGDSLAEAIRAALARTEKPDTEKDH
ncbi:MAG TPA: response regulator [Xanthobacteraceae bacterium]|nr:response regulator [Xanthobacteraceae bacterium]